jgi:N-acylneuraminate cytidylyltransferase
MILGIIPARGGSKGVPRKNIREICGKPLIAWTIEAAKQSRLLDRFVVSTEDAEIAEVARKHGAEVIERPMELATDEATTIAVLQDVVKKVGADVVVVLQPTSPIRSEGLIDRCIQRFMDSKADSLATGFTCKHREYGTHNLRRQDIGGFFYDDGNVYVIRAGLVRKGDRFGSMIERFHSTREESFEIDDELDFWVVEQILGKRFKATQK